MVRYPERIEEVGSKRMWASKILRIHPDFKFVYFLKLYGSFIIETNIVVRL